SHGQNLVDQENVWLNVNCDRECQPHVHARGIELDLRVKELTNLREFHDGVEVVVNLAATQSENRAVEIDVVSTGQIGVESGTQLKQCGDLSATLHGTGAGVKN